MNSRNIYTHPAFDRLDRLRQEAEWLSMVLQQPATRLLPMWRNRHPVDTEMQPLVLGATESRDLLEQAQEVVLLGRDREQVTWLALDLSHLDSMPQLADDQELEDLRKVGPLLPQPTGALLAHARAMLHWHRHHQFCGVCGSETQATEAGHLRVCLNPDCSTPHHPRTDPAVIMLVHDGDYCLLGRQPVWPPGMHSNLAGFVEPGESLEDAVRREVWEESGVKVGEVRYHSSQPWPFPASIMLGFYAAAESREIQVDGIELEFADWFHRDQLLSSPENEQFHLPRRDSISWRLIEDWMYRRFPLA